MVHFLGVFVVSNALRRNAYRLCAHCICAVHAFFADPVAFAAVQIIWLLIIAGVLGIIKIWTFPTANPDTEACTFGTLDSMLCYAAWIACTAAVQMRD